MEAKVKKSTEQWPVYPGWLLYIGDEILPSFMRMDGGQLPKLPVTHL